MTERQKRFVIKGITYETKPGPDWSLVYYDRDDDVHLSMAIFGQATITKALFEAESSRTSSELFGIGPSTWQFKAIYQNNLTEQVRRDLQTSSQQPEYIIWYLVLGTGEIRMLQTESKDFATAYSNATYPEIPEGSDVDDYIEILGIARADSDPELIV